MCFFGLAKPHQKKNAKILSAPPSPPIPPPPPYNARTIRACTPAQHEKVKALLDNDVPAIKIRTPVRPPIGYSIVLKMRKNYQNFGTRETPRLPGVGRPAKIAPEMGQAVVYTITITNSSSFTDFKLWYYWGLHDFLLYAECIHRRNSVVPMGRV